MSALKQTVDTMEKTLSMASKITGNLTNNREEAELQTLRWDLSMKYPTKSLNNGDVWNKFFASVVTSNQQSFKQ